SGKPWPYHLNVYDLASQNQGKKSFTQEAMRANRARGNFICGYAEQTPNNSGDRGHLHADTAESWIVMLGELRWVFDGDVKNAVIAREGDIVYAVPGTFHSPQFGGKDGLNCRLTNSPMPSLNHLYDAKGALWAVNARPQTATCRSWAVIDRRYSPTSSAGHSIE